MQFIRNIGLLVNLFWLTAFLTINVSAANFVVNTNLDQVDVIAGDGVCGSALGNCALRAAVQEANQLAGDDTITFNLPPNSIITLALGEIIISGNLTVNGSGANNLIVSGTANSRVFNVPDAAGAAVQIELRNFTVSGGNATTLNNGSGLGGGISALDARLTFENMVFSGNTASANGGGIYAVSAQVVLRNTILSGNAATTRGGGLYLQDGSLDSIDTSVINNSAMETGGGIVLQFVSATFENLNLSGNRTQNPNFPPTAGGMIVFGNDTFRITINNSTVANNVSAGGGGGLDLYGGIYTISNSVFNGNQSSLGGAIRMFVATVAIVNTTISGNTAITGGGIFKSTGGTTSLRNVTLARNVATDGFGGAIDCQTNGELNFGNTIIADSADETGAPVSDIYGPAVSVGYNLIENQSGSQISGVATGNLIGVDPRLQPLGNYGGRTQTHALTAQSPAFNAGNMQLAIDPLTNQALASDQRGMGFLRVVNGQTDIGAFETRSATAANVIIGGNVYNAKLRGIARARITLTAANGGTRTAFTNSFGYYRFAGVAAGEICVISVAAKQYSFAAPSQIVTVGTGVDDLNFVAEN